jgi:hypothetical protein
LKVAGGVCVLVPVVVVLNFGFGVAMVRHEELLVLLDGVMAWFVFLLYSCLCLVLGGGWV